MGYLWSYAPWLLWYADPTQIVADVPLFAPFRTIGPVLMRLAVVLGGSSILVLTCVLIIAKARLGEEARTLAATARETTDDDDLDQSREGEFKNKLSTNLVYYPLAGAGVLFGVLSSVEMSQGFGLGAKIAFIAIVGGLLVICGVFMGVILGYVTILGIQIFLSGGKWIVRTLLVPIWGPVHAPPETEVDRSG
jgi:hypothetical protein